MSKKSPQFTPLKAPKSTPKTEWRGGDYYHGNTFITYSGDVKVVEVSVWTLLLLVSLFVAVGFVGWVIFQLALMLESAWQKVVEHRVAIGFVIALLISFAAIGYWYVRSVMYVDFDFTTNTITNEYDEIDERELV